MSATLRSCWLTCLMDFDYDINNMREIFPGQGNRWHRMAWALSDLIYEAASRTVLRCHQSNSPMNPATAERVIRQLITEVHQDLPEAIRPRRPSRFPHGRLGKPAKDVMARAATAAVTDSDSEAEASDDSATTAVYPDSDSDILVWGVNIDHGDRSTSSEESFLEPVQPAGPRYVRIAVPRVRRPRLPAHPRRPGFVYQVRRCHVTTCPAYRPVRPRRRHPTSLEPAVDPRSPRPTWKRDFVMVPEPADTDMQDDIRPLMRLYYQSLREMEDSTERN